MVVNTVIPSDVVQNMRMPVRHCHEWSIRLFCSLPQRLAGDSVSLHHGDEGRPGQSKSGGSSAPSADHPIGFTKRRRNVCPLGVG